MLNILNFILKRWFWSIDHFKMSEIFWEHIQKMVIASFLIKMSKIIAFCRLAERYRISANFPVIFSQMSFDGLKKSVLSKKVNFLIVHFLPCFFFFFWRQNSTNLWTFVNSWSFQLLFFVYFFSAESEHFSCFFVVPLQRMIE